MQPGRALQAACTECRAAPKHLKSDLVQPCGTPAHPQTCRGVVQGGGVERAPQVVDDASDDLPNDQLFRNASDRSMRLPSAAASNRADTAARSSAASSAQAVASDGGVGNLAAGLMREGAAKRQSEAAAASAQGAEGSKAGDQQVAIVRRFAGASLLLYNGSEPSGFTARPTVRDCKAQIGIVCAAPRAHRHPLSSVSEYSCLPLTVPHVHLS